MKKNIKINWNSILNNSSSIEAIVLFALGYSVDKTKELVWDKEVRKILNHLKRLPVKAARRRARAWLNKNFISWGN